MRIEVKMPVSTDITTAYSNTATIHFGTAPPPKEIGRFIYRTGHPEGGWGTAFYQFVLYRKPKWITRCLLKLLFDIEWEWKWK